MARPIRLHILIIAASALVVACSSEPSDDAGVEAQREALAEACDQYLGTYNEVSGRAMDQFYKL